MAWLSQFMERLRAGRDPAAAQERRVMAVLLRRPTFAAESAFVAELAGQLPDGEPIAEPTIELIAAHMRGSGEEIDRVESSVEEHLALWTELARRSGSQLARACRAELLLRAGQRDAALEEYLDALEREPILVQFRSDLDRAAREGGGEPWLRYRLALLRAALAGLWPGGDEAADDEDAVREVYCELLEEYCADPEALARIRELGPLIDQAALRGDLPRAIVRRGPRP